MTARRWTLRGLIFGPMVAGLWLSQLGQWMEADSFHRPPAQVFTPSDDTAMRERVAGRDLRAIAVVLVFAGPLLGGAYWLVGLFGRSPSPAGKMGE